MARLKNTKNKNAVLFKELKQEIILTGIRKNMNMRIMAINDPEQYLRIVNRLLKL